MSKIEIRGVWLTNTDSQVLNSQSNITRAIDFLAKTGFNVIFPVVWNKAKTLYPSRVMQRYFNFQGGSEEDSEIDPLYKGRDPLEEIIAAARTVGMKVIPWFEYGFASSYKLNGGRLLAKKPEWSARDRNGNLLQKNGFEWLNAFNPQVQNFMRDLILEVAQNYDVDGIQGDDRLPALPREGGYDKETVARYYQHFGKNPPKNPKDKQWLQWRADILTEFWGKLHQELKTINPNLIVSLAPSIPKWGYQEYLQDCNTWVKQGLVDMIHPQVYRRDFFSYKQIIDSLLKDEFNTRICGNKTLFTPGILMKVGSYLISPDYLIKAVEYNRSVSIPGEVFFFYEGLCQNNNQLANILRSDVYRESAIFPNLRDFEKIQSNTSDTNQTPKNKNLLTKWLDKLRF